MPFCLEKMTFISFFILVPAGVVQWPTDLPTTLQLYCPVDSVSGQLNRAAHCSGQFSVRVLIGLQQDFNGTLVSFVEMYNYFGVKNLPGHFGPWNFATRTASNF